MVTRYLASCTSSMRAPLSAIEPISSGVSKVTRGERSSASLRLTICGAAPAAPVVPATPGAAGWPDACGAAGLLGEGVVCCWAGKRSAGGRHGIVTAATPRPAAAQAMGRQPAAAQRAMARHRLGGVGRAGGFVAAGAREKKSGGQAVEAGAHR